MFTHVMVGATDLEASKRFYDATLGALGIPSGTSDPNGRVFYSTPTGLFAITRPLDGGEASGANGGTIGFAAQSPEQVESWHAAGVANGGTTCESPPGPREVGGMKLYSAYMRDPAGNKICAVHRQAQ
jgi:catechol 2,3-dioxygenase-like lactoylglutathione lyase family enzyme